MAVQKEIQRTTFVCVNSSQGLVCSRGLVTNDGPAAGSLSKNVISKKHDVPLQENIASRVNDDCEIRESMVLFIFIIL